MGCSMDRSRWLPVRSGALMRGIRTGIARWMIRRSREALRRVIGVGRAIELVWFGVAWSGWGWKELALDILLLLLLRLAYAN